MDDTPSFCRSKWECKYHVVQITKYRRRRCSVLDDTQGITMSYGDAIFANQRKRIPIIANEFEHQIIGTVESTNRTLNRMVTLQLLDSAIHRFCGRACKKLL